MNISLLIITFILIDEQPLERAGAGHLRRGAAVRVGTGALRDGREARPRQQDDRRAGERPELEQQVPEVHAVAQEQTGTRRAQLLRLRRQGHHQELQEDVQAEGLLRQEHRQGIRQGRVRPQPAPAASRAARRSDHRAGLAVMPSQILYSLALQNPLQPCFIIYMQASPDSRPQTFKCTICLERAGRASIDGCQHGFCLKCIRRWSNSKNTCPLCREPFLLIRHLNRTYRVRRSPQASKQTEPQPRFFRIPRQVSYLPVFLNPVPLYFYYPAFDANMLSVNYAFSYNQSQNVLTPTSFGQFS